MLAPFALSSIMALASVRLETVSASAPCPAASSAPRRTVTKTPRPASSPPPCTPLLEIGHVGTIGRKANLVGTALSASTGTIGQEQISTRPLLRPGEVLEDIPGLIISQHSGGGKANQYYLRGFQLDHGTNLEATIEGVPVNLPSHAHGQGYSDINYLLPELVSYVQFKKGLYFADQGDFAVAGGYELYFRDTIKPTLDITLGDFGYDRIFSAASTKLGTGHFLYGVEIAHDNGSYVKPDEYRRFNGLFRYSHTTANNNFAITGIAYNGPYNSTDQIPQRLVDDKTISRYGYVDPSDGGNTYRYALSSQFSHASANGTTKVNVYGVHSFLTLFSNFTYSLFDANDYYNVTSNPVSCNVAYTACKPNTGTNPRTNAYQSYCPANTTAPAGAAAHSVIQAPFSFSCGDQRQQVDKRVYYGFDFSRDFRTPGTDTTLGIGLRNDNIAVNGLYLTNAREQYANGTLSNDHIVDRSTYAYVESELHLSRKLRFTPALRLDSVAYHVAAFDPANSGAASQTIVDPKFSVAYALSPKQEVYADFGESFHSNDARGVIGMNDPQSHAPFDPSGAPIQFNAPMTRASGEEIGYRYSSKGLTTTFSAYQLLLANELIFDGDHGTTSVGGPTVRRGIELSNFYTPTAWLTFDADLATATARFIADPLSQGTAVPESLAGVISFGATVDEPRYAASLRLRYFGPRNLDQTGDAVSPPTTTLNTQLTAKLNQRTHLTFDLFNILNSKTADVTYFYGSWLKQDAANPTYANDPTVNPTLGGGGVNDYHFHPSQARTFRLTLTSRL